MTDSNDCPLVVRTVREMQAWSHATRGRGERIALVPTMGFLHEGHVSLLKRGKAIADRTVMSLFVNPTQFSAGEDLARYPQDWQGDFEKASRAGVDVVFAPNADEMYPVGHQTTIRVADVSQGLCGARRPGHFDGVATVVAKLFHAARPDVAVFGEKDFQQLMVIRRMVRDLDMGVEIQAEATLREPDGLAMSSRNTYLNPTQRKNAVALYEGLQAAAALARGGEDGVDALVAAVSQRLEGRVDKVDYVEVRDAETLSPLGRVDRPAVVLVAAYLGSARLIDNIHLKARPGDAP